MTTSKSIIPPQAEKSSILVAIFPKSIKYRRYICIQCNNKFTALTVKPLSKEKRVCAICYKWREVHQCQ